MLWARLCPSNWALWWCHLDLLQKPGIGSCWAPVARDIHSRFSSDSRSRRWDHLPWRRYGQMHLSPVGLLHESHHRHTAAGPMDHRDLPLSNGLLQYCLYRARRQGKGSPAARHLQALEYQQNTSKKSLCTVKKVPSANTQAPTLMSVSPWPTGIYRYI